jgi:WD40 repeat protein
MQITATCPDVALLERLMVGQLSPADAERLGEHVLTCPHCGITMDSLHPKDQLVEAVRGLAKLPADTEVEVIDRLVERLTGLPAPSTPPVDETANNSSGEDGIRLSPALEPGEIGRLGPFRILRLLGAGGMGRVYLAEDVRLKRSVALKVMKADLAANPTHRERFLREARSIAALEHDHIVTIHQVGEDQGTHYLAMQLLHGETLEMRLRRQEKVPVAEAVRIAREIAEGLAAAHARGLTHRDIKPANIWLQDGSDRVKILDFGLARFDADESHLTLIGGLAGTPAYMAPEQAEGKPRPASDLFSLGCVLYHMCAGVAPFRGTNTMAVLSALVKEQPAPPRQFNPDVPRELSALVMKLLAKNPQERYQSAREVATALAPAKPAADFAKHRSFKARMLAIAAVVLALAGAILYVNTGEGTLLLEVNESDVTVTVDGKLIRIKSPRDEVTLRPGRHTLHVSKEGFSGHVDEFEIRRGGKVELTAKLTAFEARELRPAPALPPALAKLARQMDTGLPVDPADTTLLSLREQLVDYRRQHALAPESVQTAELMAKLVWPADALRKEAIPVDRLLMAMEGDARQAPSELVAIFGGSRLSHWAGVNAVALEPEGKWLASGSWDGTIKIWDTATGSWQRTLKGHEGEVLSIAFRPHGSVLASGGTDGRVRLWDWRQGEQRHVSQDAGTWVNSVAYSADGKILVSGARDGRVKTFDPDTGNEISSFVLNGHSGEHLCLAISPDGTTLASGSRDQTIKLWDSSGGQPRKTLAGHAAPIWALAFSPNGRWLASASWDGNLKLWNPDTGVEQYSHAVGSAVVSIAFSADSKTVAAGNVVGRVGLWDVEDGTEKSSPPSNAWQVRGLAFSPDGQTLYAGNWLNQVNIWNVATGQERFKTLDEHGVAHMAAFGPDGRTLASGGADRTLRLWDVASAQLVRSVPATAEITAVAFSPDGQTLAVACADGTAFLYDSSAEGPPKILRGHQQRVRSVAFGPDGRLLATASWDRSVRVWNAVSGEEQRVLTGQNDEIHCVAFSPDGRLLASGSADGSIFLWAVDDSWTHRACRVPAGRPVSLAFSPDGTTLAAATDWGKAITFWDTATARERRTEFAVEHTADVLFVAYSSDGRLVASCGRDGAVRLWDALSGRERRNIKFPVPRAEIHSLAFSPDGRHLATANGNGTVFLLRLSEKPAK